MTNIYEILVKIVNTIACNSSHGSRMYKGEMHMVNLIK